VPEQTQNMIPRDQRWWALSAALISLFTGAISVSIVTTALPTIVTELHGFTLYGWVFTSYALAASVTVPLVGKLSDTYGRRPFMIGAFVLFICGCLLAGLAPSMLWLIAARCISGAGGGSLIALSMIVIGDIFSLRERAKWIGVATGTNGIAVISGPVVGGVITQNFGWRWVFFAAAAPAAVALVIVARVLPRVRTIQRNRPDLLGSALLTPALIALLLGFTWGGTTYPWVSSQEILLFSAALLLAAAFVVHEAHAAEPLIPLDFFRNRLFTSSLVMTAGHSLVLAVATSFVPLYLQGVLARPPQSSGLLMAPMFLTHVASSIVCGQIASRTGKVKPQAIVAASCMTLGMVLLSRLGATSSIGRVDVALVVLGLGTGGIGLASFLGAQAAVSHRYLGTASSTRSLMQNIATAISVPVMTAIIATRISGDLPGRVPPGTKALLAGQQLDAESLVTPSAQVHVRSAFAGHAHAAALYHGFLRAFRGVLADGISEVFLVTAIATGCVVAVAVLQPRMHLRADQEPDADQALAQELAAGIP
jgi:EmrB/QacA subfamily drug resistance transporter